MIAGTERDRECRSSTEAGTRGLDLAVLQPDELANDGEAKAEAAVAACSRAVRLPEPIEHMRKKAGVYPDSGIGDFDFDAAIQLPRAHGNATVAPRELDGVTGAPGDGTQGLSAVGRSATSFPGGESSHRA